MNPISSRTRSRIDYDRESDNFTITLRSSILGLEGLVISIPRVEDGLEDSSDFTYIHTEGTDTESEEEYVRRTTPVINFDKLNKFIVKKSNLPSEECPICLDAFKLREHGRQLGCTHIFHKKCVDRWLAKNPRCPVCRTCVQPQQPTQRSIRILRSQLRQRRSTARARTISESSLTNSSSYTSLSTSVSNSSLANSV
jgi:hypothetical protein